MHRPYSIAMALAWFLMYTFLRERGLILQEYPLMTVGKTALHHFFNINLSYSI